MSDEEKEIKVRQCGMVYGDGVVCMRHVYYQEGCCSDKVFNHKGPHEATDKNGRITHRWKQKIVIEPLPFDGYMPLEDDDDEL